MKGNDILKAMNGLDERYVSEYESFEPKRKISVKRRTKLCAAIAAAVAVLTIPAGAYVYDLTHKEAVKFYLEGDSADYIEQNGLALNYTSENEHIRLTVDTLLSDGHIGEIIMTVEGLDEQGLQALKAGRLPEIYLADVETGDYIQWGGFRSDIACGGSLDYGTRTDTQYTVSAEIRFDDVDIEKDYLMRFGLDENGDKGIKCEYDEQGIIVGNIMEGISVEMSFAPNVECVELQGENGEQVWLSQIGIFSDNEEFVEKNFYSAERLTLIKNVGLFRKEDLMSSALTEVRQPGIDPVYCQWFRKMIDIGDYAGVELNSVQYLKTE